MRIILRTVRLRPAASLRLPAGRTFHAAPLCAAETPGSHSRTNPNVKVEYPAEDDLPSSRPVRGHGGGVGKPTLPTFSLDGRVAIVTGGARGLGLVMGQGLVYSGADLALVDLNSMLFRCCN